MTGKKLLAALLVLALVFTALLPAMAESTLLQKGDTGEKVADLQARLIELGYLAGDADGIFDEDTEAALMTFQRYNGLLATGIADRITLEAVFSENAEKKKTAEKGLYDEAEEAGLAYFMAAPMATSMPASFGVYSKEAWEWNTNEYTFFRENGFQSVSVSPFSTFAADVDTASYAQLRSMILAGKKVSPDAVRIEEMLNYFQYDYPQPQNGDPFGVFLELAPCPWNEDTLLLQVVSRPKRSRRKTVPGTIWCSSSTCRAPCSAKTGWIW